MSNRRLPSQMFAVGKDYESRLKAIQRRPDGAYLLNHGTGRYSAFRPEASEGCVRPNMIECVGIDPARAMEYFGLAIRGKRVITPPVPLIKPTLNTFATMFEVPDNYPSVILSGTLSGTVYAEKPNGARFNYMQALGSLHSKNVRAVDVRTTKLESGKIFWEATGDNTSDELIVRDDFLAKVPAKLTKKRVS